MGGRSFAMSRREAVARWSRAVQQMAGGAAVTVTVTWLDEEPGKEGTVGLSAESQTGTQFGATSAGRPIASLEPKLSREIADRHIDSTVSSLEQMREKIHQAFAAGPANGNGDPEAEAKAELQRLREDLVTREISVDTPPEEALAMLEEDPALSRTYRTDVEVQPQPPSEAEGDDGSHE